MQIAVALRHVSPNVFHLWEPKPLVVGAQEQIRELLPAAPERAVHQFLSWWCNRRRYLKATAAEESFRYHANGHRGPQVTDEHREHAAKRIEEISELWKKEKESAKRLDVAVQETP